MHWDWLKAIGGMFRIGAVLLVFSFIVQNLNLLNNLFLDQVPTGTLLLLIFAVIILHNIYRTFTWYFTWLKGRKNVGSMTNVIVHFFLYAAVFFVTLSVPVPTLVSTDLSDVSQQFTVEKTTPGAPGDIIVTPSSSSMEYYNQTEQYTASNDTDKSYSSIHALDDVDGASATNTITKGNKKSVSISQYETSPKTVTYEYVLRGSHSNISYIVYRGMNDHLRNQPRYILYRDGKSKPTDTDFIMKDLDNEEQKAFIDPLVNGIKNITSNKDDQARIAISLVQNINYDSEGLRTGDIKGKYPYEVLYTGYGVCSEKSELLAYMLRELDYGVVIFRFRNETHDAVGIKCPYKYSYRDTGYCFVESTSPSIVTYSSGDYEVLGNLTTKLTSMPEELKICDGNSFDSVSEEYYDAQIWGNIGTGKVLDEGTYNTWLFLINKYGMKTEGAD